MKGVVIRKEMFEDIKHVDDYGSDFWYARELMPLIEYSKWQNFEIVINAANEICKLSNYNVLDQFTDVSKLIVGGKGNKKNLLIK